MFLKDPRGAELILPDIFIVADFRLFHSGVPVHLVDDYSKGQEINLLQKPSRAQNMHRKKIKKEMTIYATAMLVCRINIFPGRLTRMIRQAGPMKLQIKWFSVLSQHLQNITPHNYDFFTTFVLN